MKTLPLCLALTLFACTKNEHTAAPASKPTPPHTEVAGASHYGAALSAAAPQAAAQVLADPQKFHDKDVKLTGQVGAVCQNKGCWMTLGTGEPGAQTMRVTFKDYGFFVPRDCVGKQAVVEGHFQVTTLSQAEAQHYADDAAKAGAAREQVSGPQRTLALVATAVELH